MQDGRELPGFRKKSFALPFDGGEIWFEHLDGIYGFTELVLEKLTADMPQFQRPSSSSNIGFVLNETDITEGVIEMITKSLLDTKKRFMRVAFIGADRRTAKELKKRLYGNGFGLGFFGDFEKAKQWLVSEGE
ncbi:MAG: hypothetical protein ACI4WS_09890 [Oscillospiraceae bacterium]